MQNDEFRFSAYVKRASSIPCIPYLLWVASEYLAPVGDLAGVGPINTIGIAVVPGEGKQFFHYLARVRLLKEGPWLEVTLARAEAEAYRRIVHRPSGLQKAHPRPREGPVLVPPSRVAPVEVTLCGTAIA
jgi:hypothetical protein